MNQRIIVWGAHAYIAASNWLIFQSIVSIEHYFEPQMLIVSEKRRNCAKISLQMILFGSPTYI